VNQLTTPGVLEWKHMLREILLVQWKIGAIPCVEGTINLVVQVGEKENKISVPSRGFICINMGAWTMYKYEPNSPDVLRVTRA